MCALCVRCLYERLKGIFVKCEGGRKEGENANLTPAFGNSRDISPAKKPVASWHRGPAAYGHGLCVITISAATSRSAHIRGCGYYPSEAADKKSHLWWMPSLIELTCAQANIGAGRQRQSFCVLARSLVKLQFSEIFFLINKEKSILFLKCVCSSSS